MIWVVILSEWHFFFAGELKNPSENIPKCVVTALTLVALIYLLVNISYLAVLTPREIVASGMVAQNQRDFIVLNKGSFKYRVDLFADFKRIMLIWFMFWLIYLTIYVKVDVQKVKQFL